MSFLLCCCLTQVSPVQEIYDERFSSSGQLVLHILLFIESEEHVFKLFNYNFLQVINYKIEYLLILYFGWQNSGLFLSFFLCFGRVIMSTKTAVVLFHCYIFICQLFDYTVQQISG